MLQDNKDSSGNVIKATEWACIVCTSQELLMPTLLILIHYYYIIYPGGICSLLLLYAACFMGTRVRLPSPDPPGLQAYISPECTLFSFCFQMYDHHNIQWEPISALLEAPTQLAGVLRLTVSHNASALYFSHGRSWHQTLCNIPFRQHQCNYQKCSYFSNLPRYFDPLVDYVLSGNPAKFIESSYTAP